MTCNLRHSMTHTAASRLLYWDVQWDVLKSHAERDEMCSSALSFSVTHWKQTYTYEKRPTNETYHICMKREAQKRPTNALLHLIMTRWMETYIRGKRLTKETYQCMKRDLQKRPTKETYWRSIAPHQCASLMIQRHHTASWKETCKRDVCIDTATHCNTQRVVAAKRDLQTRCMYRLKEIYKMNLLTLYFTSSNVITLHHTSSRLISAFLLRDTLKGDLHTWKETYKRDANMYEKRPTIKDLLTFNDTSSLLMRPHLTYKRDVYRYEKRPIGLFPYLYTSLLYPPKNGVIALWPNTRVVKCKYYVSQKQNGFNNKIHWYSILLTFIFKFTERLWWTKIYVISNLSNCRFTTWQY